jgi:O-antigen/teichoic acid export membrane protein
VTLHDPTVREVPSRVRRGLKWKLFSEASIFVSRTGVAVVLAHLLTPRDFGVAGMALVLTSFVITFADLGLGNALVQRRSLTEADRSTMFWTSVVGGACLTLLTAALSSPIARFYGEPRVRQLFMVLGLSFFVIALGATQRSLLSRAMNFRSLELRNVAGVVAGAAAGIALAVAGFGAWALIVQSLTISVVSTVLLWAIVPWRPQFRFSSQSARELGGFGLRSFGGSLFTIINQISDKILIGRYLGAAPLGAYVLAFNTVLVPLNRIVAPIQQLLYPALSRLQDDRERVASTWLRVNTLVLAVCAPLMVGTMLTASDLVPVVFGPRWHSAIPVLEILSWVSIMQAVQGLCPVVLQALNRPATTLWFSLFALLVNFAAYVVGLRWGIVGVAACFAVSSTGLAIWYVALTARAIGVRRGDFLRSIGGVSQGAAAMAAGMLLSRIALGHTSGQALRLVLVLACGVLVYVLVCLWRAPEVAREFKIAIRNSRRQQELPTAVPNLHPSEP